MSSQLANPGTEILDEIMHLTMEEHKIAPSLDRMPIAVIPCDREYEFFQALRASGLGLPSIVRGARVYWHGLHIMFSPDTDKIVVRL